MRFLFMAMLLVSALLAPASTLAAEGTVSAQVTVATPCITVGPSIDYGTASFSTANPPNSHIASGESSYTNCSNSAEQIYVRGTDAASTTSAAAWQLTNVSTCNAGVNFYRHSVGDLSGTAGLTLSDQLLNAAAGAGVTKTLYGQVEMPCSGSSGAGETMTFSIIVTASF